MGPNRRGSKSDDKAFVLELRLSSAYPPSEKMVEHFMFEFVVFVRLRVFVLSVSLSFGVF